MKREAFGLVISEARASTWRPQWAPILAVLLDLAALAGLAALLVAWTAVPAEELQASAGAACPCQCDSGVTP
jgi:hypothetical protein